MVKKIEAKFLATLFVFMAICGGFVAGGADTELENKCSAEFQKVTACLAFATGKAAAPSTGCCDAVKDLKESEPACLCFFILQIHNGSNPNIKQTGVQESRLLQLPSVCKLTNASITECPKLLHLPANSSDAAIFTNANATMTTPGTSPPTNTGGSNEFRHGPQQLTVLMTVVMAIFFYAFPAGV
ncbi:unnamed protein product [Fraxinus pennsylvanica]|uniref:Bifunctional inhibitor/plant lipid transfer protein/seed storage helical domain-containing protein n=1 Tax=Fraxinus pennsylvanica TaxID=56036 RepID=A0AAD2E7R9_9LAMI|nr:unnamed protein product [Fraxinus pennsylvanica]